METENLIELLENGENSDIRSRVFTLEGGNLEDQPLFPHQMETMRKIYQNDNRGGIIRYPTGGGKTRTGIAYMAKEMERMPNRKFFWGGYPKDVIRQGMLRLAELAGEFDDDITFAWYDSNWKNDRELFEKVDILFIMRDQFSRMMEHAQDGRVKKNPLLRLYDPRPGEEEMHPTMIYDECHQLGANKLQDEWDGFTREFSCSIHTMGLSATPIPTQVKDSYLLSKKIFPLTDSIRGDRPEWNMLCHHDVPFSYLQERDVLCDINEEWNERGDFDITVSCPGVEPLPSNPSKKQIQEFAKQFNKHRMSSPEVIQHLADDVADNIQELRKTLLFAPTINCANRLMAKMEEKKSLKGRVTMVHSGLSEFNEATDVDVSSRNKQVQAFKGRGDEPCVMINVGMLTTGFDDPNIQTVILGRLVTSNNLFWQMIGRGLRGTEVGGTVDCNVIDPIRLTEKYEVFDGYRATIEDKREEFRELLEMSSENEEDGTPAIITTTKRSRNTPNYKELSEEEKEVVARALNEFADYETFKKAVDSGDEAMTSLDWCYNLVEKMEDEYDADLSWMKRNSFLPDSDDEVDLKHFHRKVEVCMKRGILSREEWMRHVTSSI